MKRYKKFSIKKLSIGVISIGIGFSISTGSTAFASEIENNQPVIKAVEQPTENLQPIIEEQPEIKNIVTFNDDTLKSIINKKIAKDRDAKQDITIEELSKITELNFDYRGVSDLTGLENATNLTSLSLEENMVANITPLAKLTKLSKLGIGSNSISDISALNSLTALQNLNLANNDITNINSLSNLNNLEVLSLTMNKVTDISALANLSKLNTLYLGENKISNIKPLENLTNLTELDLAGNKEITDISPLENLTNLNTLYLTDNKISNIEALRALTNLNSLFLNVNNLTDINPLENLTELTNLRLNANKISDLSPLANLTNLKTLLLPDNLVSDLTPLANLTNISNINLSNNSIYDLSPLEKLDKINKKRGYAKQKIRNFIAIPGKEFLLPIVKDFTGNIVDYETNEDGTIKIYVQDPCATEDMCIENIDGESVAPMEVGLIKKGDKYLLPEGLTANKLTIEWFVNTQWWGNIIINVPENITEKEIPFEIEVIEDNNLPLGQEIIIQEGILGKKLVGYIQEEELSLETVRKPRKQIVHKGTLIKKSEIKKSVDINSEHKKIQIAPININASSANSKPSITKNKTTKLNIVPKKLPSTGLANSNFSSLGILIISLAIIKRKK